MKSYQRLGLAAIVSAVTWFGARSLNDWAYQGYATLQKDVRAPIYFGMRKSLAHLEEARERISDEDRGRHRKTRTVSPGDLYHALESLVLAEKAIGDHNSIDDNLREARVELQQRYNGQSYRSHELRTEQQHIDRVCGEIQDDALYRSFYGDIVLNNVKEVLSWGLYALSVVTALSAIAGETLRKRMKKTQP